MEINREARDHALQLALVVPLLAALVGLVNSFRIARLPDLEPAGDRQQLL